MKKEKIAFGMFMVSIVLWLIVMIITPVGGWCESNEYHNYYMYGFTITGIMSVIGIYLIYLSNKELSNKLNKE